MRVIFFGNVFGYSLPYLEEILEHPDARLVGILSPPEGGARPAGGALRRAATFALASLPGFAYEALSRRRERLQVGLLRAARAARAPLWQPASLSPDVLDEVAATKPDLVVMAGFDRILRQAWLDRLPRVLNVHHSLLPRHRGPLPELWTIVDGDETGGVTIHEVAPEVDAGDVVGRRAVPVDGSVTGGGLRARCCRAGRALLRESLGALACGQARFEPQRGAPSYEGKPRREDLLARFDRGARHVYDRARAATPWAGVEVTVPEDWWREGSREDVACGHDAGPGRVRLELSEPRLHDGARVGPAGTLRRLESGALVLSCADGAVEVRAARPLPGDVEPSRNDARAPGRSNAIEEASRERRRRIIRVGA